MKKIILIVFLSCFTLFFGCADKKENEAPPVISKNIQINVWIEKSILEKEIEKHENRDLRLMKSPYVLIYVFNDSYLFEPIVFDEKEYKMIAYRSCDYHRSRINQEHKSPKIKVLPLEEEALVFTKIKSDSDDLYNIQLDTSKNYFICAYLQGSFGYVHLFSPMPIKIAPHDLLKLKSLYLNLEDFSWANKDTDDFRYLVTPYFYQDKDGKALAPELWPYPNTRERSYFKWTKNY